MMAKVKKSEYIEKVFIDSIDKRIPKKHFAYSEIPLCDSCGQEMSFSKRLPNGKNKNGNEYRRIRYYCEICEIYHTQYADGAGDAMHVIDGLTKSNSI